MVTGAVKRVKRTRVAVADGAAAKGTIGQLGNTRLAGEGYSTVGECSSEEKQRVRWNGACVEKEKENFGALDWSSSSRL